MFRLHIVLPSGTYLEAEVSAITLPSVDGQRTVLPNHMALVLPLEIGNLYTKKNNERTYYHVSNGTFTFEDNLATLMVETIESQKDIDFNRALRAKERAEKRLEDYSHTIDMVRAEAALKRALSRLRLKD